MASEWFYNNPLDKVKQAAIVQFDHIIGQREFVTPDV